MTMYIYVMGEEAWKHRLSQLKKERIMMERFCSDLLLVLYKRGLHQRTLERRQGKNTRGKDLLWIDLQNIQKCKVTIVILGSVVLHNQPCGIKPNKYMAGVVNTDLSCMLGHW